MNAHHQQQYQMQEFQSQKNDLDNLNMVLNSNCFDQVDSRILSNNFNSKL